ncbi:hypothetical protein [Thermosipho atlanticus]|uniref:Uncharacterized protein n=1 Tax=Thermosipho atlanticus DSM 15807 TaxID=1123380 RepID=A0A1M5SSJ5_9BACT|nr:hypothetical protein [Thermosipho atlanticus]SHH41509.1 hypothetical protein SAMN02745199_1058 [Thermosipho atlanticus DSM 15807]
MLSVTAYSTLMFIVNIVLGAVLALGIIQQGKSTFGIASVTAWIFFVISLSFFISGGFSHFFSQLGISLSPIIYALIGIFSIIELKLLGNLQVRQGMRLAILFSLIFIAFLIIDFFVVKNATLISLFSIGWAYIITLIVGIKNRNIK